VSISVREMGFREDIKVTLNTIHKDKNIYPPLAIEGPNMFSVLDLHDSISRWRCLGKTKLKPLKNLYFSKTDCTILMGRKCNLKISKTHYKKKHERHNFWWGHIRDCGNELNHPFLVTPRSFLQEIY